MRTEPQITTLLQRLTDVWPHATIHDSRDARYLAGALDALRWALGRESRLLSRLDEAELQYLSERSDRR